MLTHHIEGPLYSSQPHPKGEACKLKPWKLAEPNDVPKPHKQLTMAWNDPQIKLKS